MTSLKEKGINAFIWDLSGKIATNGMGFFISIILARVLAPSEFGLLAMVVVILAIAQVFTDTGLSSALIQRHRLLPVHYSSVFYFNILAGSILSIITYFSAGLIADFYNNDRLIPLTEVMSVSFILNALGSVQGTKLRKELRFKSLTKIKFSASLVSGIVGVYLAINDAGVWSLVVQSLLASVVFNLLIWNVSGWTPTLQFSIKALNKLWGFGFRMFVSSIIDTIFTRIDIIVIGKMFLPETLGYFQRAKSLSAMATRYSSASLMAVLYPILSEVKNDLPRFQNIVMKSLGIISFVAFLLLGLLFLISEELIILLFTEKWRASIDFFKILVLSGYGYPISVLLVNVLTSRGKSKDFLRLEILKKTMIAANLYVGFSFGIETYLYGLVLVTFMGVTLNALYASREINLEIAMFLKPILLQMLICTAMVSVTTFIMQLISLPLLASLILKGVVFFLLYFITNKLLDTISYQHFIEQVKPFLNQLKSKFSKTND